MPLIPIAMALAQFAPMIAGWLGGSKAEEVAGKVVGIAQQVTGQSSPDATVAALAADPNLAFQFQKAVLDQQAHLAEISADLTKAELAADVQHDQIDAADRDSARKREIAVKDATPMLLAIFVTLGFFGLLGFMAVKTVPQENSAILNTMLGSLGTGWLAILYYYFGSSRGSDRKTELMAKNSSGASQ